MVVFSATHPKKSSTSMQVSSQAQRVQVKTVKVAVLQHQQSEWPWNTQNIIIIQQNPEANSLVLLHC